MKKSFEKYTYGGLMLFAVGSFISCSSKTPTPAGGVYFSKVKTIISQNCLSCHSSTGSWQGRPTAFDTDDQIAALYASIKSSVADPVSPRNKRMPQGGSLNKKDIDIIVAWYNKGGKSTD